MQAKPHFFVQFFLTHPVISGLSGFLIFCAKIRCSQHQFRFSTVFFLPEAFILLFVSDQFVVAQESVRPKLIPLCRIQL